MVAPPEAICETASERALLDSARTGNVPMIEMADQQGARTRSTSLVRPWLDMARNVAQFANEDGSYDDLLAYLRKRRLV